MAEITQINVNGITYDIALKNKPIYTADEVGAISKGGLKTILGNTLEGNGDIDLISLWDPEDEALHARLRGLWVKLPENLISDAPSDDNKYLRCNNEWAPLPIMALTLDQYDSLSEKDENIFYFILEEE